jgi:hypothetical protein
MQRVCKRHTSNPLVRAFLDNYGLNLLSIPQKLTLKLPKKSPRTLRGQSAPVVAAALVGAPDGDIFITIT